MSAFLRGNFRESGYSGLPVEQIRYNLKTETAQGPLIEFGHLLRKDITIVLAKALHDIAGSIGLFWSTNHPSELPAEANDRLLICSKPFLKYGETEEHFMVVVPPGSVLFEKLTDGLRSKKLIDPGTAIE